MKIYISGAITGHPDGNRLQFQAAANAIIAKGHEPVNPHDIGDALGDRAEWNDYMKADIKALLDCDAILMLPGWEQSIGAKIENQLAFDLWYPIYNSIGAL